MWFIICCIKWTSIYKNWCHNITCISICICEWLLHPGGLSWAPIFAAFWSLYSVAGRNPPHIQRYTVMGGAHVFCGFDDSWGPPRSSCGGHKIAGGICQDWHGSAFLVPTTFPGIIACVTHFPFTCPWGPLEGSVHCSTVTTPSLTTPAVPQRSTFDCVLRRAVFLWPRFPASVSHTHLPRLWHDGQGSVPLC